MKNWLPLVPALREPYCVDKNKPPRQPRHTRASVSHRQQKRLVVSLDKILILELGAVDGFTARSALLGHVVPTLEGRALKYPLPAVKSPP